MPISINGDGTVTGINSGGLPDGSITNADIADDAVIESKIANNAVTDAKIANNAVTDAKISAVAASKLTGTVPDARFPATLPSISGANLTNLPIQAEEDYFTLDMSSATGTTVHSITASFTPKLAWMTYNPNGAFIGLVTGWMNVSGGTAGSFNASQASAGKYWQGNVMFQCACTGGAQDIDMTASASGQYTITNTHPGGSLSGTGYFSLILFGN